MKEELEEAPDGYLMDDFGWGIYYSQLKIRRQRWYSAIIAIVAGLFLGIFPKHIEDPLAFVAICLVVYGIFLILFCMSWTGGLRSFLNNKYTKDGKLIKS